MSQLEQTITELNRKLSELENENASLKCRLALHGETIEDIKQENTVIHVPIAIKPPRQITTLSPPDLKKNHSIVQNKL